MAKTKRSYPVKRKKAVRSRESYLAKDHPARQAQLSNLVMGKSGGKRKWRPPVVKKTNQSFKGDLQRVNIIQFAENIIGIDFEERPAQRVMLKSLYGLPLDKDEIDIYRILTTLDSYEPAERTEAIWAVGARGGKSTLVSVVALYEATRDKWKQYLQDGEIGYACIIATREKQAQDIIGANCARMIEGSMITDWVEESYATTLVLTNGMYIASYPCNSTAARGLPIFLLIFDEIAHFSSVGPKADEKIYSALRPRQAQFPGAKCLKISTPAAKQGLLWDEFSQGFQVPGRLTIQAPTRTVNPTIPQDFIDNEYLRDPDNAEREFGANFAEQVDAYLPFDKLQKAFIFAGDLLPDSANRYFASIDQSGLSGRDRFAMAVSHKEDRKVLVDVCRSWNTEDGDMILGEVGHIANDYNLGSVTIDKYAGGWVKQALEKIGLEVKVRESLPSVYQNFKSLLMAESVKLPDNKALRNGLVRTQAFYGRNNSLSISHERTVEGHADEADATVTAVWEASSRQSGGYFSKVLGD